MSHVVVYLPLLLLAALPEHDPQRRVHDLADILPLALEQQLETLAHDVEQQTTAQLAVVTVTTLDGSSVELYANKLFNSWGIGQRNTNNGVLLLIAPRQRKMRIEVGYGLEPLLTDALCGEIRDEWILPAFKKQDYPQGIRDGTEQIAAILRKHPDAARGVANSAPLLVRTARRDSLLATAMVGVGTVGVLLLAWYATRKRLISTVVFAGGVAVLAVLLVIALAFVFRAPNPGEPMLWFGGMGAASAGALGHLVRRYRRFGPHGCSQCGTRLELLDEQADDKHLSEIQQLEEKIGSVDYDVWYCPACLHTDTERYVAFFSGFSDCPSCPARAFKQGPKRTVTSPTRRSTGMARIESRCVSCKHKTVQEVVLPQISDSTSSGSSWGGGGGGCE